MSRLNLDIISPEGLMEELKYLTKNSSFTSLREEKVKQELWDFQCKGNITRLDASQSKGMKRKTLDASDGQGFKFLCHHTSSATNDREEVEGIARRLADESQRRISANGNGYSSRLDKRLKLKSSISSRIEQRLDSKGGRVIEEAGKRMINLFKTKKVLTRLEDTKSEDKKGKAVRRSNDKFKRKLEDLDCWNGNYHQKLGADFDRSRIRHRSQRYTKCRTDGQHPKEYPKEDCPGITWKTEVDFQNTTTSFQKGNNLTFTNKDGILDRDNLNCGSGTILKSRSGQESKPRRNKPKRCQEEVDWVREREGEVFFKVHDVPRGNKQLPWDRSDRFRSGELEEEDVEGRWDKQVFGEEDMKHGEGRRHGYVRGNGNSLANNHKQNATRMAYKNWQEDEYDHRDGHNSYQKTDHVQSLPRNQTKMEKTSKKEKYIENQPVLVMETSGYQRSSKEDADHSSRGCKGRDQLGNMDPKDAGYLVHSQISKASGASRRSYSSTVIALNHPNEQDVRGITNQYGGKWRRSCKEAGKVETCSQTRSTLDKITKLPNLEAVRSSGKDACGGAVEGSRQVGEQVDCGAEAVTEDMLNRTMRRSPMLKRSERKNDVEAFEGHSGISRKSDEALQLKQTKCSAKEKKMSSESLLRRRVVNVDWHKQDVSAQDNQRQNHRGRSHSVSPKKLKHGFSPKAHGKSTSPHRSDRYRSDWDRFERGRRKTLAPFDSRYRRFGGGTSGLGGYSPRRRRSEAAVKTPSPPPRSPERKKEKAWDSVPTGMDSSVIAAISAAHQAAVKRALATLATVNPLVLSNMLISPSSAPSVANCLTAVPPSLSSLQPQRNPVAVTLTQATRPMRRLSVGNVPPTVSDGELLEFMNKVMLSTNANHLLGTKPCINCSVNMENNHAVAEFITPEDATAALAFDGATLHGTTLKIQRPKDFVQPANGGIESLSAVPDMVSSRVVDSPHKVFVGGIPPFLTADKVKEIVTAFGQLKAYHWEVDTKKQPSQAYAFLEYLDPTVTVPACAALNGIRLGTEFLTVVQATPDADAKSASNKIPFYGIPEHAKSLLEAPTCVLELHNLVAPEDVVNMSKEDIEDLIEDVRLECIRFGNVKSTHIVQQRSDCELKTRNKSTLGIIKAATAETNKGDNSDNADALEKAQENIAQAGNPSGLTETLEEMLSACVTLESSSPVETFDKQNFDTGPADGLPSGHLTEENGKGIDANNCCLDQACAKYTTIAKSQGVSGELCNEWQASTSVSQVDKISPTNGQEVISVQDQDTCGLTSGSRQEDISFRAWENSHMGKVYVEFSREESACQAAHAVHGRLFDGRKVAVCYFPLESYQTRFPKGLGPPPFEDKQALAVVSHGHLTADIED